MSVTLLSCHEPRVNEDGFSILSNAFRGTHHYQNARNVENRPYTTLPASKPGWCRAVATIDASA